MSAGGPILVGGAGIAGLTAALAFARRGYPVQVFERAERLEEAGAGIQLSPNATRLLFALGLHDPLLAVAPRPEAVCLIDAGSLRERARVPLGAWGEARWGAPYLTCRRADLQRILADAAAGEARIALRTGASVVGADLDGGTPRLTLAGASGETVSGSLLVAADGVHSPLRASLLEGLDPGAAAHPRARPRAVGLTAWRTTVPNAPAVASVLHPDRVSAFLAPRGHLVAYPSDADRFNLVAFSPTRGEAGGHADAAGFRNSFASASAALSRLVEGADWSAWPLLTAPEGTPWAFRGKAVLIGDAAHAMAPFAAQGAATAIEDAWTLAAAFAASSPSLSERLARWEARRRDRIASVVRRGRLNRLTWHAGGAVALARNLVFSLLPAEKLARDLDWLYGWRPDGDT